MLHLFSPFKDSFRQEEAYRCLSGPSPKPPDERRFLNQQLGFSPGTIRSKPHLSLPKLPHRYEYGSQNPQKERFL